MISIERKGKINICRLVLGVMRTNTYIVYDEEGEAFIADPADSADIIRMKVTELGVRVRGILLTHGHFDHIGAVKELRTLYGVKVYAHEREKEILGSSYDNLSELFMDGFTAAADIYVTDGQELSLAGCTIKVIHTPGHTAGSVCYIVSRAGESVLLSGDTMFAGSFGRYDFPTGSYAELMRSIKEKLLVLEDGLQVYPGHNESTTIGEERVYY